MSSLISPYYREPLSVMGAEAIALITLSGWGWTAGMALGSPAVSRSCAVVIATCVHSYVQQVLGPHVPGYHSWMVRAMYYGGGAFYSSMAIGADRRTIGMTMVEMEACYAVGRRILRPLIDRAQSRDPQEVAFGSTASFLMNGSMTVLETLGLGTLMVRGMEVLRDDEGMSEFEGNRQAVIMGILAAGWTAWMAGRVHDYYENRTISWFPGYQDGVVLSSVYVGLGVGLFCTGATGPFIAPVVATAGAVASVGVWSLAQPGVLNRLVNSVRRFPLFSDA